MSTSTNPVDDGRDQAPSGTTTSMGIHQDIARRLARLDQRYTALRRALVETMAAAGRPLTIPEMLVFNGGLSQSSAYRNVSMLVDAGVVRRVVGHDDHGRFELVEELAGGHHHHLVCGDCGRIADVLPSPHLERALTEAARAAAQDLGYEISDHRLDLVGVCPACRL